MPIDTDPNRKIIIKQNPAFLFVGTGACLMSCFGVRLFFGLLPLEAGYSFIDIFGVIFVCVWILLVLGMGCIALEAASRKVTIDREGVYCQSWFQHPGKRFNLLHCLISSRLPIIYPADWR